MTHIKVKITENGRKNLDEKIAEMEKSVKEIQAEKAIAYTLSGDGWHDNPGFNQLEQKEYHAVNELQKLKITRETALVVITEKRNINTVQIGSIVEIEQFYYSNNATKIAIWEIVGHQESNLKLNHIAYDTPVGSALLGKKMGEMMDLTLPIGKVKFKVIQFYENWEFVKTNNTP